MTQEAVPAVWMERLKSLNDHLTVLATDVVSQGDALPRGEVLRSLIGALGDFGQNHFDFFAGLYRGKTLNSSDNFPPEYVMRQVIARIAEDAQVIQNCIDQRRPRIIRGESVQAAQLLQALEFEQNVLLTADKLAWAALRPAIDGKLLPELTTAITYFQKATTIRVIPYASVALIGIPITCLQNPIDFLAIPHEVGHYVYWNSGTFPYDKTKSLYARLSEGLPQNAETWIKRWSQEIFADTYGALVAQGAIARSFQDLEDESAKDEFVEDDKRHPSPLVRPDIYADVIERRNPDLAKGLRKRWAELLQKRKGSVRLDSQGAWVCLLVEANSAKQRIQFPDELKQNYTKVVNLIQNSLPLDEPGREPRFPGSGETDVRCDLQYVRRRTSGIPR